LTSGLFLFGIAREPEIFVIKLIVNAKPLVIKCTSKVRGVPKF